MKENTRKKNAIKDPLIDEEEDSYGKSDKSNNSFDEGKLQVNTNTMGKILSERKEMIQDFKIISSQVNDLSKTVIIELQKQGQNVNKLENKANIINQNAKNVKKETKETEEISKKNYSNLLGCIILSLVILLIILFLIKGFISK